MSGKEREGEWVGGVEWEREKECRRVAESQNHSSRERTDGNGHRDKNKLNKALFPTSLVAIVNLAKKASVQLDPACWRRLSLLTIVGCEWDGMERNEWDGMGRNGMGWDGMGMG